MRKFRGINPFVRAVAVIGSVTALATGVTFAALTSNTVSLTDNTLAAASAHLRISNDNITYGNSASGMNFSQLVPGVQSNAFTFYINNDGDIPLNVTGQIGTDISPSTIPPSQISLAIDCGGGAQTKNLADWVSSPWGIPGSPLNNGNTWTCTARATLDSGFSGSGSIVPFVLNFVGTQV